MFMNTGRLYASKTTIETIKLLTNRASSHIRIVTAPVNFRNKNAFKTCSCKLPVLSNIRQNSSSGDSRIRKSEIFENIKQAENGIGFKKFEKSTTANESPSNNSPISHNNTNLTNKYKQFLLNIDPYVKLARIDKPTGTWLLFWPCGWSMLLAADPSLVPLGIVAQNMALFLTGAFIMRGAGCTINDMWDRDIDAKVERTKSRPLVNGQLSMKKATAFLAAQLSAGLTVLLQLNWYSVALGASSMILVVLYPLAKRITDYPQAVLGLTFNWGALLGWSALRGSIDPSICYPLYGAGLCWTLLYDTIYAHQDKTDDMIIGIKSTALKFNNYTKPWLWANATGMLTGLGLVGIAGELQWPYYLMLGAVGGHLGRQIYTLKKDCPQDCSSKFISNSRVGLLIFLGVLFGKWDAIKQYVTNMEIQENFQNSLLKKSSSAI